MRVGFVIGFLAGAAVASVIAARSVEAPESEDAVVTPQQTPRPADASLAAGETAASAVGGFGQMLESLKARLRDAQAAAREEAQATEAKMRREFEETLPGSHGR